jgi:DNA polymerase-3 subunit alpha
MYLIFDTETTGLPKNYKAPITDTDNWPRCVQIAWQLHDEWGKLVEAKDYIVKPDGYTIPFQSEQIHGISTLYAQEKGVSLTEVLQSFNQVIEKTKFIVGQNVDFDLNIMGCEFYRMGVETQLMDKLKLNTCTETTAQLCQLPGGKGGKFKLPTLSELHNHLFENQFEEAHNASADVEATARSFFELIRTDVFQASELENTQNYIDEFKIKNPSTIAPIGLKHINFKKESKKIADKQKTKEEPTLGSEVQINPELKNAPFAHLHTHSQYSVLESTLEIAQLVKSAANMGMSAVSITDTGNMMGVFSFVQAVSNHNSKIEKENEKLPLDQHKKTLIPIVGSEFNICENHLNKTVKDNGFRIVLIAKNKAGYHNLVKLSSISHTEGYYYVPRIDKELLLQYKDNLIALSGNLMGEIPNKILNVGEQQAEEALLWWKEHFGNDFYLELNRHGLETEDHVNKVILEFSKKHQVKMIAANDVYYLSKEDSEAQDILVCVKEGDYVSTPKGFGRGFRRGLENDQYYFKSPQEMKALFADIPDAILNIQEIVDKIEPYVLKRDVLLPKFDVPDKFKDSTDDENNGLIGQANYLRHLTYEGAKKRWNDISTEIQDRLEFELNTIITSGYQGYFLIVWDLIAEARNMDVSVGPGRGSAAGSAVAYCLWITNIDPIKYDLLFERFLNPDRVSMPDIDIDFDDDGRQKVIEFVTKKYGQENVAQIITYGTMGAKSAIRDTGRVMQLPLNQTDRLAKMLPGLSLEHIVHDSEKGKEKVKGLRKEEQEQVVQVKQLLQSEEPEANVLQQAAKVEGSVRNTGVHACGFIITPEKITNLVPIATAKDTDMYVTQFDNAVVENAGLLKMDFLGLKTLSLIKDTVEIVKAIHKIDLVPDEFPLDDEKTYELFQKGETIGIFQFESAGMRKSLKELKPTVFADLIAMVALYRPGPMDYIPLYIDRKHGRSPIEYDLPEMEEILKETYGVTVYQEQVMRLSQVLSNFSKGDADMLRKAMGKKIKAVLDELKPKFINNGMQNHYPKLTLEKIWADWEKFASYAFNKSHATCYAYISFQTAYLKAHYPAEFMAAMLSHNMNDIKKLSFYMDECKHANIPVLGPDVNESWYKFAVNKQGAIRFGMGGVKGVGQGAVENIIDERKNNGHFTSIFDFAKRVDLRAANKRVFEGLAYAGGFDSFENTHRAQYFDIDEKGQSFIDKAIRFGNKHQESENSSQISLFGGDSFQMDLPEPDIPNTEPWGIMRKLSLEKEVVGIYISGHPLDDHKHELKYFCNATLNILKDDPKNLLNRDLSIGGIVTDVQHRIAKNGNGWAVFTLEDYNDVNEFRIFGEDYLKYKHLLTTNAFLMIRLRLVPSWKEGETRMQYIGMQMLQEVMQSLSKKLTIYLDINELNDALMNTLSSLIKKYKGKKELNFVVYHMEEQLKLHMPSRKFKINISNDLLKELEEINWKFEIK